MATITAYRIISSSKKNSYYPIKDFEFSRLGKYQAGVFAASTTGKSGATVAVKVGSSLWVTTQMDSDGKLVATVVQDRHEITIPLRQFYSDCKHVVEKIMTVKDMAKKRAVAKRAAARRLIQVEIVRGR